MYELLFVINLICPGFKSRKGFPMIIRALCDKYDSVVAKKFFWGGQKKPTTISIFFLVTAL